LSAKIKIPEQADEEFIKRNVPLSEFGGVLIIAIIGKSYTIKIDMPNDGL